MTVREYKPGDRVRVTEKAWIERARGKVGTVQSYRLTVGSTHDFVCRVRLDGDDTSCTFAYDHSLEPLVEDEKPDNVNHPAHYNWLPKGVEVIDITENLNFSMGNAVKYILRADHKGNPIEDLRKAAWYIQREIDRRSE